MDITNQNNIGKVLCLDIGSKSMGVAITDSMKMIAIPLDNFIFEEKNSDLILVEIENIINKEPIEKIIIGYPKKTTNEKATISEFIDEVISKLKKKFKNEVILFDERFSTQRGIEMFSSKIKDKKDLKEKKDMYAAYVMLSDWLSVN